MTVVSDWRHCKDLRIHRDLQIEDQPGHTRAVLSDTHRRDVGVVWPHLRDQTAQGGIQLDTGQINHQPMRVGHGEIAVAHRRIEFECDAGVVARRPDAHRDDAARAR